MKRPDRRRARELAARAVDGLGWFEELYREASAGEAVVPWDDGIANPHVARWLDARAGSGRALDVGCGFGDTAEDLARRGYEVTACDISPTAIAGARARFPQSRVDYLVANVLEPPASWTSAFDLVVEAYTLQVLRPSERRCVADRLRSFVAPGGTLLVVTRARDVGEAEGAMPWPLLRSELEAIATDGLQLVRLDDFVDDEDPPVRRFLAAFQHFAGLRAHGMG